MDMFIYKMTNKINDKLYVGQTTKNIYDRFREHCYKSSNSRYLKRAITESGVENFSIELIQICDSISQLDEREEFWIKELNSLAPNGYNLTTGGAAPRHNDLTKEKMSATRKGRHPSWATEASRSEESRAKRSVSHLGKECPQERKDKIQATLIAQRGKKIVDQNGVVYNTVIEAVNTLNLNRGNIQMQLRGLRKKVGEYTFKFV